MPPQCKPKKISDQEPTVHNVHLHFTLKMEAARTSEASVPYYSITWRHTPEDLKTRIETGSWGESGNGRPFQKLQ